MTERTADVQRDIELTRERMSETIAEIDARIAERIDSIRQTVDVSRLIERYPLAALAVAVGVGALLAGTGADKKAARATAEAAKKLPDTGADLAQRGWEAATNLVRRDDNGADDMTADQAGLLDRLRGRVTRATGVDDLLGQMRDAAAQMHRPASYAGQPIPQNTGQVL